MNKFARVLRFGLVGFFGFIIDAGVLSLFVNAGGGLYVSRLVSFPCAVTITWYLNRIWSFKGTATKRPIMEYGVYFGVQVVAALANLAAYAVVLNRFFGDQATMVIPALAIGAALGMVINFVGSQALVFTGSAPQLDRSL